MDILDDLGAFAGPVVLAGVAGACVVAIALGVLSGLKCAVLGCEAAACPRTCWRFSRYHKDPHPCGLCCKQCGRECAP
jgi:hypothetical protein